MAAPLTIRGVSAARYAGQVPERQLAYLERIVEGCTKCESICKERTRTVFGEGCVEQGGIFIVGEAPGVDEDALGRPFIGRAGQLLVKVLRRFGLLRNDVYLANCLKCRPNPPLGMSNRPPTRPELVDCLPYLYAQIEILKPCIVVALGNTALEGLGVDKPISKIRGTVLHLSFGPVVPTWHPAYVLRNPTEEAYTQLCHDFQVAVDLVTGHSAA